MTEALRKITRQAAEAQALDRSKREGRHTYLYRRGEFFYVRTLSEGSPNGFEEHSTTTFNVQTGEWELMRWMQA